MNLFFAFENIPFSRNTLIVRSSTIIFNVVVLILIVQRAEHCIFVDNTNRERKTFTTSTRLIRIQI